MPVPLVATKLNIPPLQRELVPRPRLIELLNEGLESKLILLSSPAGYGKTILLSAWANQCRIPVAWISLDEGDNDLVRFLSYLVSAIGRIIPDIIEHVFPLLQARQILSQDQHLAMIINEIAQSGQPFVIVLDDYHLIQEPAIHNSLIYLLAQMPSHMHIVVASRADPPLPVARLRARSQLTELRMADLCFTDAEAAQFYNQVMQLDLQEGQIATLTARTEGWIAGLQMAAISLRGAANVSDRVQSFSGSNRFILDYLGEEVLKSQPEAVLTFLMKTSILDRLTSSLCDAVTGWTNSQEILEQLERDNLFIIPLDEERSWYRYHQLFLDLLRSQARQRFPGELAGWHQAASEWFERHNDLEGAVHHALTAANFERAAGLLEVAAQPFLISSEIYTFRNWIRQLPEVVFRAHPNLVLYSAWVLALAGTAVETVKNELEWLERNAPSIHSRCDVIRAFLLFSQGEVAGATALLHHSLADLRDEEELFHRIAVYLLSISDVMSGRFDQGSQGLEKVVQTSLHKGQVLLAAGALCNLAEVHLRLAQLKLAREAYERVLSVAVTGRGQRLPIAGKALIGLADVYREWNDLRRAEESCLEGIELARYLREAVVLSGYITLARIRHARGNAAGAQSAVQTALEISWQTESTRFDDLYVMLYQALLAVRLGDLDAVEQWIRDRGLSTEIDPADLDQEEDYVKYHLLKYELLVYARWLIARNDAPKALYWLNIISTTMEQQGRIHLLIEALLLSALAHFQCGDLTQALGCFKRSLALAEPGGYMRLFLDEGKPIQPLLMEAARGKTAAADYAGRLLSALDAETHLAAQESRRAAQQPGLVEALTEREVELLALIAAGLSNQEISRRLYISLPTVKWHIGNIFGKLSVRSRTQAVAQARALGILPVD